MSDQAQGDHRELESIQRQLADTRQHIAELEALISDLPEIYERKFEQQLQPLLEQERLLLQQNLLLRDQLQRALPGTASQLLLAPAPVQAPAPPTQAPATPGQEGAALGPGVGTGPLQPPAQPQPGQTPSLPSRNAPNRPRGLAKGSRAAGPSGSGAGKCCFRTWPGTRATATALPAGPGGHGCCPRRLWPPPAAAGTRKFPANRRCPEVNPGISPSTSLSRPQPWLRAGLHRPTSRASSRHGAAGDRQGLQLD